MPAEKMGLLLMLKQLAVLSCNLLGRILVKRILENILALILKGILGEDLGFAFYAANG